MITTAVRAALRRKGMGYTVSRTDDRDRLLSVAKDAVHALPSEAMAMCARVVRRNQGATSECTAASTDHCLSALGGKPGKGGYSLRSMRGPYWGARTLGGYKGDNGAQMRDSLLSYRYWGTSAEAACPQSIPKINQQPSKEFYRQAHSWRDLQFESIVGSWSARVDSVRASIARGRPVVGGWSVDAAFLSDDGPDMIQTASGLSVGGHAIAITGYQGSKFRSPGSWSDEWRDGGWAWFSEGMVAEATELYSVWYE